jgi:hypothetical protein
MVQIVSARIGMVLDRVRKLSEADYAKDKGLIVRHLIDAVFAPPTPEEQKQLAAAKPPQNQADAIRAKMLQGSKALRQWELAGKDPAKIEDLFARARQSLYANKLTEADKLVDEALGLLGITPPGQSAAPAPTAGGPATK